MEIFKHQTTKDELIKRQVEEFKDFSGVSTKSLEWGVWLVKNKQYFLLIVIWTLVVLGALFWSYVLYYAASYLAVGLKQDQENLLSLSGTESQVVVPRPENYELKVSWLHLKTIPTASGRYDLLGSITNDNEEAYALFTYFFRVNGRETQRYTGFVYPKETRYLVHLSEASDLPPYDAKLVVEGMYFGRFNKRNMPDWASFKANHYDFLVKDKSFSPASRSGLSENLELNRLSFNITNRSAYSYRQAEFLIILYNGSNIIGVDKHIIPEFRSKERYQVNKTLVGSLSGFTNFEVVPSINILNDGVYLRNY